MGLVGVAELLECVAEPSGSLTGAMFGLIIAAIGQVIFLTRHRMREKRVTREEAGHPMNAWVRVGRCFNSSDAPLPSHDGDVRGCVSDMLY